MRLAALFTGLAALTSLYGSDGRAQPQAPAGPSTATAITLEPAATLHPLPAAEGVTPATATLCGALEAAARRIELPLGFFTRLIWQESRFDPAARSPAGARPP